MAEMSRRQQQAIATKHALVTHAVALFAVNPYEQVSIKDICEQAGVSVGAFYHHFKSKDELLDEGYRVFDERVAAEWGARRRGNALDDVYALADFQIDAIGRLGAYAAAQYYKNQLSVAHGYMLSPQRYFNAKLLECVNSCVQNGLLLGEAQAIADDVLCVIRGTIYDWCLHENSYDLAVRTRHLLEVLLEHYRS